MKFLKSMVRKILTEKPSTRDNDELLVMFVWCEQNPKLKDKDCSFRFFGEGFIKKNYASPASVARDRRKLQEQEPNLRGKLYEKRHQAEKDVRKGIFDL